MKTAFSCLKPYKYVSLHNLSKKETVSNEHLIKNHFNYLFLSGLNENIDEILQIKNLELKSKNSNSVFIGGNLDALKIQKSLIKKGKSIDDIFIAECEEDIYFKASSADMLTEVFCHMLKSQNIIYDETYTFGRLCVLSSYISREVVRLVNNGENVKNKSIEEIIKNSITFNSAPLKEQFLIFYNASQPNEEITLFEDIPQHFFDKASEMCSSYKKILHVISKDKDVLEDYKHIIFNIKNKTNRAMVTAFSRYMNDKYNCSHNHDEDNNMNNQKTIKTMLFVDFEDYILEGYTVLGCTERRRFSFNVFLNSDLFINDNKVNAEKIEQFHSFLSQSNFIASKHENELLNYYLKGKEKQYK